MYIIAIAWIYVVLLMAVTEPTLTASIMTFLFYCVFPLALLFYLIRTPQRKRLRQHKEKLTSNSLVQTPLEKETNIDVVSKEST